MRRVPLVLATAVGMVLLVCGVAAADEVATNFEPPTFHTGSVNGQDGWKSAVPGDIPSLPNGYDQRVVANAGTGAPAAFGSQSLRQSNAYGTGPDTFPPEYHFQTYSKPTTDPAGEEETNTVYTARFSFISFHPDREQPRLQISVSPDMGEGGRMSYIGLTDTADGIAVTFFDTPEADGKFKPYDLGTLPRNVVHTIRFWMKLNAGPDNDLVRIFIDGRDVGQCFTTWENFYRRANQEVPNSDRLLFLSGNRDGDRLSLLGGGYLFDDVTTTTANRGGPAGCDLPVEKEAEASTVSAGGRVGYRITVRNRGRAIARNVRVCDRIPRRMTFVSADRNLRRFGRLRCLVIPRLLPGQRVSFHIVLQVDADAPPGTMENIADVIPGTPGAPGSPGPSPSVPGTPTPPAAPPVAAAPAKPIARDKAIVKVKRAAQRARPTRPPFTG